MGMEAAVKFHGQLCACFIVVQNRGATNTHQSCAGFRRTLGYGHGNFPVTEGLCTHGKIEECVRGGFHPDILRLCRQKIGVEAVIIGHGLSVTIFVGLGNGQKSIPQRKFQSYPETEGILRQCLFVRFQHQFQTVCMVLCHLPDAGVAETVNFHPVGFFFPDVSTVLQPSENGKQKGNAAPGTLRRC